MKFKMSCTSFWTILWFVLAAAACVYGFLVLRIGSGTGFFAVWFLIAACFLLLAAAAKHALWSRLPLPLRTVLLVILIIGAALFVFVEAKIISGFSGAPVCGTSADSGSGTSAPAESTNVPESFDYIIVLGAQVRMDGPSAVLRYRLEAAAGYLNDHPDTVCIVSGGQGYNEPYPEADGMRDYLIRHGIPESRIIAENRSRNTKENIENCLRLSASDTEALSDAKDPAESTPLIDPSADTIGIVTNNFHAFRGVSIAKKAGMRHVYAVPAYSNPLYLPNNLLREFLGVVKDFLQGNI